MCLTPCLSYFHQDKSRLFMINQKQYVSKSLISYSKIQDVKKNPANTTNNMFPRILGSLDKLPNLCLFVICLFCCVVFAGPPRNKCEDYSLQSIWACKGTIISATRVQADCLCPFLTPVLLPTFLSYHILSILWVPMAIPRASQIVGSIRGERFSISAFAKQF